MFTRTSTISQVASSPLGSDILRTLLRNMGRSPKWLGAFGWVRIGWLERPLGKDLVETLLHLLNAHPERPYPADEFPAWWKEAVIYQIYPRSFADSNGDGIGDLRGIIDRLDTLAALGVDCLWLSPIFDSPGEDGGYDVRDYRKVAEEMGTIEDADELIAACHERGMRIILDLVVNHTSDQHEWAMAALADPDSAAGQRYFFRSGDAEPNNWVSYFSGSAWRRITEKERWVLHLFAPGQLDLNWDDPVVRQEAADIVAWWMRRGVDGFRLDVINFISKADGLPDGSQFVADLLEYRGVEHYFFGPHLHDYLAELRSRGFTRRENPASTVRLRLTDGTLGDPAEPDPVGFMVGETIGIGVETGKLLSRSNRGELDLVFNFDVLENRGRTRWDDYRFDLNQLKEHFIDYSSRVDAGDWMAVFLDNHDNPRMLSKVAAGAERDPAVRDAVAKLLATMQLTLRGTPFIFQGQECAAVNRGFGNIDDLRDVEALRRYGELLAGGMSTEDAFAQILAGTRDHARVPMCWEPTGGFTSGQPWLPAATDIPGFSVSEQLDDPGSVWCWHRDLIALRRSDDAFTYGDIRFWRATRRDYFAWIRGGRWFIELNLSDRPLKRPAAPFGSEVVIGPERGRVMVPWEASVSLRR